jgi:two-component system, sensor histidine kinase and response regulator
MERKSVEQMEQRILVAGNEDKDLQILAKPLAERGYGVTTASGGRGAIDAVRSNPPDLVLIDTEMAEMNGYEVCEQLKSADLPGDIPVIFLAASDTSVDKARVFGTGGSDYITRPFEFPEIEARVRTHLELRRQRQELEQSQARLKETERLRDNLVHMLAHDLRNSLTAISGYLELIGLTGREALSEKTLEYVRKGTDSVSALVGALNTMIDVNKMEAGTMKLNLTRFDITLS